MPRPKLESRANNRLQISYFNLGCYAHRQRKEIEMPIDHSLNKVILEKLEKEFPSMVGADVLHALGDYHEVNRSLYYLAEKGLVDLNETSRIGSKGVASAKITARGIDHLAE